MTQTNQPNVVETRIFPWSECALAPRGKNVRTIRKQESIPELAALIYAQGLQQNLCGYLEKKRGAKKPTVFICAGGRRYLAIGYNIEKGLFTPDYPVEVKIYPKEEAVIRSLTENSGREDMHPADQFRAFKDLVESGMPMEDIAAKFGVSPVVVTRRLKLANVAPEIFAEYERGETDLDCLQALALTDNHHTQRELWSSLKKGERSAARIRELLTKGEIDAARDPLALFVGIEAYKEAGGTVRGDLFREGGGYLADAVLLESLAHAKLEEAATALAGEGWAWIDCRTRLDYSALWEYGTARTLQREMTEAEQSEYDALQNAINALNAKYAALDDDESPEAEALSAECDVLEAKQAFIDEALKIPDPSSPVVAGVILSIDDAGQLVIHRGRVRPEDRRQPQRAARTAQATDVDDAAEPATTQGHSERLVRQLTAHRTAALRIALVERTDIALIALAHRLALNTFSKYGAESAVCVRTSEPDLNTHGGESIKTARAMAAWEARRSEWLSILPIFDDGDGTPLFAWLLEMPQSIVLDLIAFCTAASVDTVCHREQRQSHVDVLCEAAGLDMADWWSPTKDGYLSSIPKARVVEIVQQAVSNDAAKPLEKMKKGEAVSAAETVLAGSRWLPAILRAA